MEQVSVSKFKAMCLEMFARVQKTGQPILITKHGQPIAQVTPPPSGIGRKKNWLGSARGTCQILGDIISPAVPEEEWEVLRDP